jgi:hypothetical protein
MRFFERSGVRCVFWGYSKNRVAEIPGEIRDVSEKTGMFVNDPGQFRLRIAPERMNSFVGNGRSE